MKFLDEGFPAHHMTCGGEITKPPGAPMSFPYCICEDCGKQGPTRPVYTDSGDLVFHARDDEPGEVTVCLVFEDEEDPMVDTS